MPAAEANDESYHALCAYTLAHGDAAFIHQHVVDAFAAQRAGDRSKPIGVAFALVGLYLHVEKQWSGRQVQHAHMRLARQKRAWPTFALGEDRGAMTAADVMNTAAGPARDAAIHAWCVSVWTALDIHRPAIVSLLADFGITP